jgi:hypothetical protein
MVSSQDSVLPGLPGFDAHDIRPWTVKVVVSVTLLAVTSVVLRLWSRRLKGQQLWWDDWLLVFSMGWNLVVVGFIFAMHSSGMGLHADLVPMKDIVMMAKWLVVAEILYAFNLGWTKLSLLLMYYRIFRFPYFKKMAWVVGSFTMAWVVCITFLFIFICVPVQKLWYPELPGHCINQVGTWIANAAATILTDLVILLMPLPQIWRLRLGMREKLGLTAAFCLGFFVVFASAYRTSVLFTYSGGDPTYTLAPTVGWTAIEMSAGITSACLPTLLPVLNKVGGWFGLKNLSVRGKTTNQSSTGQAELSRTVQFNTKNDSTTSKNRLKSFYRLPDEAGSVTSDDGPAALELQMHPDAQLYKYTVNSESKGQDEQNGDDVPLHGIRVRTSFERMTVRK